MTVRSLADSCFSTLAAGKNACKSALVNSLIIALCFSWLAMTSTPSPFQQACLGAIRPYVCPLGLLLLFNMFAPEPPLVNHRVEAVTTFDDGTCKVWQFKNLFDYRQDPWLHQIKGREAALGAWLARTGEYPELAVLACQWVARRSANSANPPVSILLYDYRSPILLPGQVAQPSEAGKQLLFTYRVRPEDLP